MEKYLKEGKESMSWRGVYHFMEKMGVGTERERLKRLRTRDQSKKQYEESGIEISDFVLNQLRRILGNRKPKRRKRRRQQTEFIRQSSSSLKPQDFRRGSGSVSKINTPAFGRNESKKINEKLKNGFS